jgi:hypothetical protein
MTRKFIFQQQTRWLGTKIFTNTRLPIVLKHKKFGKKPIPAVMTLVFYGIRNKNQVISQRTELDKMIFIILKKRAVFNDCIEAVKENYCYDFTDEKIP